jgi:hypothetical protein
MSVLETLPDRTVIIAPRGDPVIGGRDRYDR